MKQSVTLITILFILFIGNGIAQQSAFDNRLLVAFTEAEISEMDANTLAFNTYCIDNAFVIMPFPAEKEGDAAINGARNIPDLENINFFELNVDLKEDEYQYFKLLGTNKMLMIKPITLIKKEL
ncbi:MAG: hypothetical protein H6600_04765 [Flavobacteriales bacterium]|nr:hypothetical protein [Flavobacteriales bacterium]MCB9197748.1 hypothetical protein [Flavobacteriales bacterium]